MVDATPIVDVSKLFSLAGKTAIVTGGTGGLGAAMTTALASAGAEIVSIELPEDPASKSIKEAVEKAGRKIKQYSCNVRDPKSLREVYQQLWSDGIKGDILLNCAGVQRVCMLFWINRSMAAVKSTSARLLSGMRSSFIRYR